jgi:hypothetical protein
MNFKRLICLFYILGKSFNKTITILDIIHCSVFYLKHDVSETGFCPTILYWAHLSGFHMKFNAIYWFVTKLDNVQNCGSYINIPSSRTYR